MINLAIKNIKEKKLQVLLAVTSIAISTASLTIFLSLSQGIKQSSFQELEKKSPLTQITIRPNLEKAGIISFLTQSQIGKLNKSTVDEISKIKGIKEVYPETQFNHFASLEADLLGTSLLTDTMIFGLPYNFIKDDIDTRVTWDNSKEPYPAIIPRKILELYNLGVALPQGLPVISEQNLTGKELTIYPNYSTLFPSMNSQDQKISVKIIGFSDKINLIGITLPSDIVEQLNKKYADASTSSFIEIFAETSGADITRESAAEIEKLGLKTQYFQKNLQEVEEKLKYLSISLWMISLIIFATSAIAISGTFLAKISEMTKEIGLFRALGATKNQIKLLILYEAGIVGILGSVTGIIIGLVGTLMLDNIELSKLDASIFLPKTLFLITPETILITSSFGILLSILSAYIPAQKAANIDPIRALTK
ncbi:FtsX-like permease family protein [Candidatus Peregrinibacteria bacterium]|nr:FtsX-like permease family protein [Candidatus Peregrinibacteria bacterium]